MIVKSKTNEDLLANIDENFEEIENINKLYQNKLKAFKNNLKIANEKLTQEERIEILDFEKETVYESSSIDEESKKKIEKNIEKYNQKYLTLEKELKSISVFDKENENNNTLIISEIQNKVLLPYKYEELIEILNNKDNNYDNVKTIIEEMYTIPLDNYKHAFISRYKEAYNLMRRKEKASLLDSIDLAFELMRKRFVHPAIITACKNLDQLDVYLDCLETNELDDFPFFKIIYEIKD